jgi:hypothetical protein
VISPEDGSAALVIAHPGHELRVHGWLVRNRPVVHVLTDGSGSRGRSRIDSTRGLLEAASARPGRIFGRLTDRDLYRAILANERALFVDLSEELAEALSQDRIAVVAGDAAEGFNPGHDVTRLLVNAAVMRLDSEGASIVNLEFPLHGCAPGGVHLTDLELERKLAAARSYPEMADEIQAAFDREGIEAFRSEHLRPVDYGLSLQGRFEEPAAYEGYGEARVRAAIYAEVIRFRQHMAPLAAALAEQVAAPERSR